MSTNVKHTPLPAILEPTPEMLDAFQSGFVEQLHLRHQCRHKPAAVLSERQGESAEQAGLRSMLAAMPEDRARVIDAAPEMLEALRPFAALAEARDASDPDMPDDLQVAAFVAEFRGPVVRITLGDCRAARAAIAKATGGA